MAKAAHTAKQKEHTDATFTRGQSRPTLLREGGCFGGFVGLTESREVFDWKEGHRLVTLSLGDVFPDGRFPQLLYVNEGCG